MEFDEIDELNPCPICFEDCGYVEEEGNYCAYVICGQCGSRTATSRFRNEEEKAQAIFNVSMLWNMGKVIPEGRAE